MANSDYAGRRHSSLTPHQAEVMRRLRHLSGVGSMVNGVPERSLGSVGALFHLERKGRAFVARREYGPRGGEYRFWLPVVSRDS